MNNELSKVKVGDKVCIPDSRSVWRKASKLAVAQVTKITKTQITAFDRRWLISSGREVGSGMSWYPEHLQVWTPERQAEADTVKAQRDAENICHRAAERLKSMRGEDAVRLAALLPAELIEDEPK